MAVFDLKNYHVLPYAGFGDERILRIAKTIHSTSPYPRDIIILSRPIQTDKAVTYTRFQDKPGNTTVNMSPLEITECSQILFEDLEEIFGPKVIQALINSEIIKVQEAIDSNLIKPSMTISEEVIEKQKENSKADCQRDTSTKDPSLQRVPQNLLRRIVNNIDDFLTEKLGV